MAAVEDLAGGVAAGPHKHARESGNRLRNAPSGLSDAEKAAFASLDAFYKKGAGYAGIMNTRQQTLGYGLADSPAGLAALYYHKFAAWRYSGSEPERALTRDEMFDDISLYWLTNTGASSSRSYWDVWGAAPSTPWISRSLSP